MENAKITAAIAVLRDKSEQLGRLPTRADLSPEELCLIKAVFGPLPRAFEAAGLKPPSKQHCEKLARRKIKRKKSHRKADVNKNAE